MFDLFHTKMEAHLRALHITCGHIHVALDKKGCQLNIFFYFFMKMGIRRKYFTEMLLMSTHSICFH